MQTAETARQQNRRRGAHATLTAVGKLILLPALMLLPLQAPAESTLLANNIAPFAYYTNGEMHGMAYELLKAMATHTGHSGIVQSIPLKRLEDKLRTDPDAFGTLWRDPATENAYTWVVKLFDEKIVLIARADSPIDIGTLDAVRHHRIGVVLGGPPEESVRRQGFSDVEAAANIESNARKLETGRIDVWATMPGVANYAFEQIGGGAAQIRFGAKVDTTAMYLACSRVCDKREADKWKAALEAMKKDGSYARILKTYQH